MKNKFFLFAIFVTLVSAYAKLPVMDTTKTIYLNASNMKKLINENEKSLTILDKKIDFTIKKPKEQCHSVVLTENQGNTYNVFCQDGGFSEGETQIGTATAVAINPLL